LSSGHHRHLARRSFARDLLQFESARSMTGADLRAPFRTASAKTVRSRVNCSLPGRGRAGAPRDGCVEVFGEGGGHIVVDHVCRRIQSHVNPRRAATSGWPPSLRVGNYPVLERPFEALACFCCPGLLLAPWMVARVLMAFCLAQLLRRLSRASVDDVREKHQKATRFRQHLQAARSILAIP